MAIMCLGVTGGIGCGKSYFTQMMIDVCRQHFIEVHHIDFDKLAKELYTGGEGFSKEVVFGIKEKFPGIVSESYEGYGGGLVFTNYYVDTKKLSKIVFNNQAKLSILNDIMKEPIRKLFAKKFKDIKSGLVLLDCALIAEHKMFDICDEKYFTKCVVLDVPEDIQIKRLKERGLTDGVIDNIRGSQLLSKGKKRILEENGFEVFYENAYHDREKEIQKLVVANILRNFVFEEGDLL